MTRSSIFAPVQSKYLGFDSLFDELNRLIGSSEATASTPGFPPCDLYKDQNGGYTIVMAVAGFSENDLTIEHDERKSVLTISGKLENAQENDDGTREVIRRGIAKRSFVRSFTIADTLKVTGAKLEHGLLSVFIQPDDTKAYSPRKISLGGAFSPRKISLGGASQPALESGKPE